ncbi:MAG TPA: cobalamin biosynthesis protein CobW [Stellaceae bacterium]|nr:cobalamin biosynthesis protein CobW [Stellaceae bacterium]
MRRVPATVITGFLGAGKTSLVRHLLANAGGRRLAVLVNEFGELGIDRELLVGCGDITCREEDIVELANGCICCTVAEDFLPSLGRLLDRPNPPEHILIETSGLALPKPLVQAFAWPEIRARTTVDGVLAVIDAAAAAAGEFVPAAAGAAHDNPVEEVFADQLAAADLAILNKSDLLPPSRLDALRREIEAGLRPGVRLLLAEGGRVPPAVALGLAAAAEDDLAARPSRHELEGEHDHDDFESFVVELGPVADETGLFARLFAVIREETVLRVKGFLDRPGRERRLAVQAVGLRLQYYFDRPWQPGETRASRLVVIGLKGLDRERVAAGLAL